MLDYASLLLKSLRSPMALSLPHNRPRKAVAAATAAVLLFAILLLSASIYYYGDDDWELHSRPFLCNTSARTKPWSGTNTLVVYAGRWDFLRISFPYIYRELRRNGGALDRVFYMMLNYDNHTLSKLTKLVRIANKNLKEDVVELHFMGHKPGSPPPSNIRYTLAYYELFSDLLKNSSNRYFKMDDDIVYIHPGTFGKMIESKNSDCCFMHFANTVTNWRCNVKHQELGVYDGKDINPKDLKFGFSPNAYCGWKSSECAELTLRAFLHHYRQRQLNKYLFEGNELLMRRKRFSINFYMLDRDLIDLKALLEVGPILADDERWWTQVYALKFNRPNCIVGDSLVVHFSYGTTSRQMLDTGMLSDFETIVQEEVGRSMDDELWRALGYSIVT